MPEETKPEVEQRLLASLKPYARNSRVHSAEQIAALKASIKKYGFTQPILIAEDGTILAGHGRVEAAKALKLRTVPTITLNHLSVEDQRSYIIADNKLGTMSSWDADVLMAELSELDRTLLDGDPDLSVLFDIHSFVPYTLAQR